MRNMMRTRMFSVNINLTPVLTSYFIFLAAAKISKAVVIKAVCEHMDEVTEFCKKYKKDAEE